MENKNNWMKSQIIALLDAASAREVSFVWHFVAHLIPAERGEAGERLA